MSCIDIKFIQKRRSSDKNRQSGSPKGLRPPNHRPKFYLSPKRAESSSGILDTRSSKRDRSKSVCFERLLPLGFWDLKIKGEDPYVRSTPPPPKTIFTRRQSTNNALLWVQDFTNFHISFPIYFLNQSINHDTRYELLNAISLTWNNTFHIRLYATCSAGI